MFDIHNWDATCSGYGAGVGPFRFEQPIRTERLVLRPITLEDFDDVHAYMGREDVAEWLLEDVYTLEKSRERHPSYPERVRFDEADDLILIAIEFEGRVIGDLDFTARSMDDGLVEIGWRLHPDFSFAAWPARRRRHCSILRFTPSAHAAQLPISMPATMPRRGFANESECGAKRTM